MEEGFNGVGKGLSGEYSRLAYLYDSSGTGSARELTPQ